MSTTLLRFNHGGLVFEAKDGVDLHNHFRNLSQTARTTSMMKGLPHKEQRFWEGQAAAYAHVAEFIKTMEVVPETPRPDYGSAKYDNA